MEYQLVFNVFIAVIGFIGGWMVNRVFVMLDRIDLDMKGIAVQYVAKDDYREDIREINERSHREDTCLNRWANLEKCAKHQTRYLGWNSDWNCSNCSISCFCFLRKAL